MNDEQQALGQLWSQPVPTGKVRYWCDDGQEGGWIDFVSQEESDRRDALKERAYLGDQGAADKITWEEFPTWLIGCKNEESQ